MTPLTAFSYEYSWIGAMMVASIHMTKKEGEEVKRGDEVSSLAASHQYFQSLSRVNPLIPPR